MVQEETVLVEELAGGSGMRYRAREHQDPGSQPEWCYGRGPGGLESPGEGPEEAAGVGVPPF